MKAIALLAGMMLSPAALAQICLSQASETTPTDDFIEVAQDEVRDTQTNLVWKRCAQGQTWDGTTCTGDAQPMSWQEALESAQQQDDKDQQGWRVPNIKELASVTERQCVRPAINQTVFPGTPQDDFWTSTPSVSDPDGAWVVAFFNSSHSVKRKDRFVYVRLVRTYTGS
ncbi:Lcl C-terminal domain-containing protein [Salinimonas iocasae]|uniref:DUF1566 domain-containing protein n=1 Tax=Salinimonas iocasae TaxID=2572577 RepID=A0A5B7YFB9_9ALTE|nr:DUF1566 domain-containing protein [Salinimonas iocasae]QCZ94397.1 DUF1566 domain-containing protein [Salinimonas iocasae]